MKNNKTKKCLLLTKHKYTSMCLCCVATAMTLHLLNGHFQRQPG